MPRHALLGLVLLSCAGAAGNAQDSRADLRKALGALWAEQRYDDLLARVEPHLTSAPAAAELWVMAAEASLKLEDATRAIAAFERALALAPALKPAAINLGFAYLKADRLDDARKVFEPFLEDSSRARAAKAHYGLGLVHAARGDAAQAKAAWEKAATLNPDDVRPLYRLGQIALQSGEAAKALDLFERVLQKDELHHGAAYGAARALAATGAPAAEAAERHRRILEVGDALPSLIRKLGAARDPVAARLAIRDRLLEAGARRAAAEWEARARAFEPRAESRS